MDNKPCHVVLGATGGISSELCRQLCASSANVVAAGRNYEKLRHLSEAFDVGRDVALRHALGKTRVPIVNAQFAAT